MSASEFLPPKHTLPALTAAVQRCQGCDLYKNATQAVFGEGSAHARMVLIGEVPGDREDIEGHPFVGPAGRLLDECLEEARVPRREVYVTNAVKHFKWEPSGKRRLHKKPSSREIAACRPWLEAEFEVIQPRSIVCLGATAAQAILGKTFRISRQRGVVIASEWSVWTLATWHPSAILRAPDSASRAQRRRQFVDDLRLAARELERA
ncbi:MAG: UdgX family uracil-DNA binding protein [Gemmataceae bacterium]